MTGERERKGGKCERKMHTTQHPAISPTINGRVVTLKSQGLCCTGKISVSINEAK